MLAGIQLRHSRRAEECDRLGLAPGFFSPLKGKPALIVNKAPGLFGGARAQAPICDALTATLARPVARPHLAVPAVDEKLVEGRLANDATLQLLRAGLDDLLAEIALLASPALR